MMRRTTVMVEVPEDVYTVLVEPMKKNRAFSKLIASLLSGYLNDGYIRAFVDDNLEEVRRAVVDSFSGSVNEMEESLANMGLFTDELHAQSQAGYSKFQQRREKQVDELGKQPKMGRAGVQRESSEKLEVDELRSKVEGLEKTVADGFGKIMEMLMNKQSEGTAPVSAPVYAAVVKPQPVEKPAKNTVPFVSHVEDTEEDTVDEKEVSDFLSSLVSDFASF